jgi:ATP-dependent exoDNAse (exonuclease V) alpha subunit
VWWPTGRWRSAAGPPPNLLATEQQLVESATGRTGEQAAVVSHEAVRAALVAYPTAGTDQQAMVRDLCQGGQGVALVVGRAGTGKTFALGIARHAWQLDGYRLLASAPTGIATLSLQGGGFEDVATCDRLLLDLDKGQEQLDPRTVLVIDEAGMVGSRKLTQLLEHAQQAQAKVVLVGDDRQLAPIDAGGGFRALRLRLGASELTENRRQQQAWEREALELVRSGLVDEAVAAYQRCRREPSRRPVGDPLGRRLGPGEQRGPAPRRHILSCWGATLSMRG